MREREVGLETTEEGGGSCAWRKRLCHRREGRRTHRHAESGGGEKVVSAASPQNGFSLRILGGQTEWHQLIKKDEGRGGLSAAFKTDAAGPAAIPVPLEMKAGTQQERTGYLSQPPARGSPLPHTGCYHGLPGTCRRMSSSRARAEVHLALSFD